MLGQYEEFREWRLAQVRAISRNVSSLTQEQFDMSKDSNWGQEVTAERIAASVSLWHALISSRCKRGQLRATCAILLRFKDKLFSCGHLQKIRFQQQEWPNWQQCIVNIQIKLLFHLMDIRITRHFVTFRSHNRSWLIGISWTPLPRIASFTSKLLNILHSANAWKKASPSWPFPNVKALRFLSTRKLISINSRHYEFIWLE